MYVYTCIYIYIYTSGCSSKSSLRTEAGRLPRPYVYMNLTYVNMVTYVCMYTHVSIHLHIYVHTYNIKYVIYHTYAYMDIWIYIYGVGSTE